VNKFIPIGLAVMTVCLAVLGTLIITRKTEAPPRSLVPPPAEVTTVKEPVPLVDEALAAVARSHPHSKKVCYDPDWGYFLDYGKLPDPNTPDDGFLHGTLLIQDIVFHRSANGTFWMNRIDDNKYISLFPDLSGLTCKVTPQ
jgi:hypothetical protein